MRLAPSASRRATSRERSAARAANRLPRLAQAASNQKLLGYKAPVFIRTLAELKEIAALEPFENSDIHGADLNIIFLADHLDQRSKAKLLTLRTGTDGFHVRGREIYWWRHKKPGTLLYSTVPLEKLLPVSFTIRSTNTIRKLAAKWP